MGTCHTSFLGWLCQFFLGYKAKLPVVQGKMLTRGALKSGPCRTGCPHKSSGDVSGFGLCLGNAYHPLTPQQSQVSCGYSQPEERNQLSVGKPAALATIFHIQQYLAPLPDTTHLSPVPTEAWQTLWDGKCQQQSTGPMATAAVETTVVVTDWSID